MRLGRRASPGPELPAEALEAGRLRRREVLAAAPSGACWLIATRTRLLMAEPAAGQSGAAYEVGRDVAWVDLDTAEWEADDGRLTFVPSDPGASPWSVLLEQAEAQTLLTVVRERLSATLVLERQSLVEGRRIAAVCRLAEPGSPLIWRVRYEAGVDPDDPVVRRAAALLLQRSQEEVGPA